MLRSISLTGDRAGTPFILEDDQPRRTQQPFHDALPTEIHGPIVEEVTAASALPIIVEIAIDRSMLAPSSRRLISTPSNYTSAATCTAIMPLERSNTGDPVPLSTLSRVVHSRPRFHSIWTIIQRWERQTSWTGSYEGSWSMIIDFYDSRLGGGKRKIRRKF